MNLLDLSVIRESKSLPTAELVLLAEKYIGYSIVNVIVAFILTSLGFFPFVMAVLLSICGLFLARLNLKAKTADVQQNLISSTSKNIFKHMDTSTYSKLIDTQVGFVSVSYGLTVAIKIAVFFIIFICLIATAMIFGSFPFSTICVWILVPWSFLVFEIVDSANSTNNETFAITTSAALDKLYEINPLRTP